ncbi:MAG: N-acetyltransferase [Paludibacteraceae bacterium]|nr:N-acetyltransferase [Paludibacteraceae bacterium]MBR1480738.1 N-acetyltransferase [Paludibacteraceae bacterium]
MITIRPVETRKERKVFVQFANKLYKDCPYYCPTLDFDELNCFDEKENPALEFSEYQLFLAYKDGEVAGRVAALINRRANERWNVRKVRFGWCDFIDDFEVSTALLDAVAAWGKSKGMTLMNGPVGFTDFDKEGALVEGYEYLAPMASLYNYPYYITHYEHYGMQKEADWIEFQIYPPKEVPERWARMNKIVMERSQLHVVKVRNSKELLKRYPNMEYFDVLDAAYQKLYNYQPMTYRQKAYYSKMYFGLLNFDFVTIVENAKNEIVGIGLGMPDISEALRKANGSLFPFGWYHILKALHAKHMDAFDLLLIGVRPDYQDRGVTALIFTEQIPTFARYGVKRLETTSILETNSKNQANFLMFDHKQHKRRRAFSKEL